MRESVIRYKSSFVTGQPMPDRFFTWLKIENTGNIPAGDGPAFNFGFSLNWPVFPFNSPGGVAVIPPNLLIAANALNPTALENFLYNSVTNTGFYNFGRVWSVVVELQIVSQNAADMIDTVIVPVTGVLATYGDVARAASAPNASRSKVSAGYSANNKVVKSTWSIPALVGISPALYASSTSTNAFQFIVSPSPQCFCEALLYNMDASPVNNPLTYVLKVHYHIEFFGRHDYNLRTA